MRMFGPEPLFRDRRDSGRALAARLERYRGRARTLTAKSLSKSSTVVSSMVADFEMPALATRMSSRSPTTARTCWASWCAPSGAERSAVPSAIYRWTPLLRHPGRSSDTGQLHWIDRHDGVEVVRKEEPGTGVWRRFAVALLSVL